MRKLLLVVVFVLGVISRLNAQYNEVNVPVGADLKEVKNQVRTLIKDMSSDIVINLEGGMYFLEETLKFDHMDSPNGKFRVVWKNKANELPRISGGQILRNWKKIDNNIIAAPIEEGVKFRQLYVNNKKASRAKYLDSIWVRVKYDKENKRFYLPTTIANKKEIKNWKQIHNVEINVVSTFVSHQLKLEGVSTDSVNGLSYLKLEDYGASVFNTVKHIDKSTNGETVFEYDIYFENALEFLDEPGEWYHDEKKNLIYYKLKPGETLENIHVIYPKLEKIVELNRASNLTFFGLCFEHSTWTRPSDSSLISLQCLYKTLKKGNTGNFPIPAAVNVKRGNNIHFERNIFRYTGGTGFMAHDDSTHNLALVGNVFYENAAAALQLGDDDKKGKRLPKQGLFQPLVHNNYFYKNGLQYGSPVVFGTFPFQLDFSHNELVYSNAMGLNLGWGGLSTHDLLFRPLVQYNTFDSIALQGTDVSVYHTRNHTKGARIVKNWFKNTTKVANKRIVGRFNEHYNDPKFGNLYLDNDAKDNNFIDNVHSNFAGNGFESPRDGHYIVGDKSSPNYIVENANYEQGVIKKSGLTPEFKDIKNYLNKGSIGGELYPHDLYKAAYIVDSKAKRVKYEGKWEHVSSQGEDLGKGGYLDTYSKSKSKNSSVSLSFVGEGIEIFSSLSQTAVTVNVYVDNKPEGTYTLSGDNLVQFTWFKKFNLEKGRHTIKVERKSGGDLIIDGFHIYPTQNFNY
ncbi:hypothetical protein EYV94_25975 [Puteibacter caeruleilacunae]|nr:hypothetical protein EYV94_25975 [Puteibacter caeruleilacunae]